MAVATARALIDGAAGKIEVASSLPEAPRAIAVVAHPHPLFGGTMDNKVVTTLTRAFVETGAATFRFNFRGVGASQGTHDEGRGETEDMLRVIEHAKSEAGPLPLKLAGFSFGGAVATRASGQVDFAQLVLVAPGFRRITGHGMGEAPDPADPNLGAPGRHTAAIPGFRRITGHGMGEAPDPADPNLGAPGRHTAANTVIVHGDLDETVPLSDSIAWAAAREVPVIVIPGGEHFFHRKLHVLREIVARWVR